MFTVSGGTGGLKGLNSNWQVGLLLGVCGV